MSSVRIKIHFYQGDKLLKKIAFQQGEHVAITIGKFGQRVDVELNSSMISRQHGQLIFTSDAALFYVDLGSTNGSFHNRNRIQPNDKLPLSIGDKLQLTKDGEFYFEVVHPDEKAKVTVSVDAQIHNLEQTDIIDKFKQTNVIIIGRAAECDVHLNAASTSF
jgi:pSer/pThr/pTyr-binding forkhead associated (FHA) protein